MDFMGMKEEGRDYNVVPLACLFILFLFFIPGCERKAPREAPDRVSKAGELSLDDTRLAAIPEEYDSFGNITFSDDGRQVFYIAREKDSEFVVVDSAAGPKKGHSYDSVSFLVSSPDGLRFAFGGIEGNKKRLVIDNKELKYLYHEEVAPMSFSPDGRLVAAHIGDEGRWFVSVSDGEVEVYRSKAFPDTFLRTVFSPDSRILVYELGEERKRIIFTVDLLKKKTIIKERLCPDCQAGNYSFSTDSSRVIHKVGEKGKQTLFLHDFDLDEEREIVLPEARAWGFILSPDGKRIAYGVNRDAKNYMIMSPWASLEERIESGPYEEMHGAIFSPDSETVAFYIRKEKKWRGVVGGVEGPDYDGVIVKDPPVFSPDGERIAYPAKNGGKWVMVISRSDKPAEVVEGPAFDMVITPVWSQDGRHIVYRARTGPMEDARRFIVIADAETGKVIKEGPVNDEVWKPVWSADGKSAAYGARSGRELLWRVEKAE
jgi:Tol biopolymer transport system component